MLTQRVDSLEHELAYLKLSYELSTFHLDLSMFVNDVYNNLMEIKQELYNGSYDTKWYKMYQENYDNQKSKLETFSGLVELHKTSFAVNVRKSNFTENELNAMMIRWKLIDVAYESLVNYMDLFKRSIDAYRELR